jgi:hypothetical protein
MAPFSLFVLFHQQLWRATIAYLDKMFLLYANVLLATFGIGVMSATAIPDDLMTTYLNAGGATLAYNYAP